tara:strand:+ start:14117 stop:14443 length:327 start_codon:yes stop_codon:yes gene_type:complete
METLHHKPIKRFSLDGEIFDEAHIQRLRAEYVKLLNTQMTIAGYVPRLDIDLDFTTSYNIDKTCFEFQLSIYGIYVGKRRSEWILGVDVTSAIFTQKSKLSEFSQEAA